jgi:hypothetical protein
LIVAQTLNFRTAEKAGRKNVLGLSPHEIEERYVGLDCEPWPEDASPPSMGEFAGLAPLSELPLVQQRYLALKRRDPSARLLYLAKCDIGEPRDPSPPNGFESLGYDYGFIDSQFNHYSVLANEVLYGLYERMASFAAHLNGRLLLPTFDLIRFLNRVRNELLEEGADLERWDESYPVGIFEQTDG